MKVIFAVSLLMVSFAFSATQFGAFTDSNQLYVTILGDCNTSSASLSVSPLCRKDRLSRNLALECAVDLVVISTRTYCENQEVIPKVFKIDLSKELVAPEALKLTITYQSQVVDVKVNK